MNYKFKKLVLLYNKVFKKKYHLNDNEREIKNLLLRLLHCEDTCYYLTPNFNSIYIDSKSKKCTIIIKHNKILISDSINIIQHELTLPFINELNKILNLYMNGKINEIENNISVSENQTIKSISKLILND